MSRDLSSWIGRRTTSVDTLDVARTNALGAALGHEAPLSSGAPLPPLRHWLHFWDVRPSAQLGPDGHPARGGLLPPVELPRRMWAGGRLRFKGSLRLGEVVTRVSTVSNIESKHGRTGPLVFVTLRHEVTGRDGQVLEEQDLVYRGAENISQPRSRTGPDQNSNARWQGSLNPDPVLLFRYSALTMNGHRIHYDRRYAVEEEGYPGLVVHGPLQATVLMDLAAQAAPGLVSRFTFRSLAPAFDGMLLTAFGNASATDASLFLEQEGVKTMMATAEWET